MHGIGNNMFQGIEQNEDSLYSSKENDESDIESGKYTFFKNSFHSVPPNDLHHFFSSKSSLLWQS